MGSRGKAFRAGAALAFALLAAAAARGDEDPFDTDPMDARAATLKNGDSESVVLRKMAQRADRVEETRCMWNSVPCLVYEFDNPHRALLVYFTRSQDGRGPWLMGGSVMENVWNP